MNLNNIKISTRLVLGFAAMGALIVILGSFSFLNMRTIGASFTEVMGDRYVKVSLVHSLALVNAATSRALRDLILAEGTAAQKTVLDELAANGKAGNAIYKQLGESVRSDIGKASLARLVEARAAYIVPRDKVRELVLSGDKAGALAVLREQGTPAQVKYQVAIEGFAALQEELMKQSSSDTDRSIFTGTVTVVALVATALALATLLALWLVRSITRPLSEAVNVARSVAAGDLSRASDATGSNEMAQLLRALKDMQDSLSGVVQGVRDNSESVATASSQIAQGNLDLSQRTEQQASALQETAATMEQLGTTVRHNAASARQASQLAHDASAVAERGGLVVGKVVVTMRGINDSSRKIGDIISVIDGIAFQTNILALNAAVEAARAGEQGRGFAVVASEVRSLAQRSAAAAKEIKTLIGQSVEQVEQGTVLVDQAGKTMGEIVGSIRRVSDIVTEISAASAEQSSGVQQVGEAVSQMDRATQQNAALVEESAAAAESLKGQAQQLVQAMAVFSLRN